MQQQNPMGGLLDTGMGGMGMTASNPNDLMGMGMGMGMGVPDQNNNPLGDLLGGGVQQPVAQPAQSNPFGGGSVDIFGGGASSGGDMFGAMQAPAAPSFPAYTAYEDAVLKIGFNFRREIGQQNNHTITAIFANKTSTPIENVSV